jgi:hypothetical protein
MGALEEMPSSSETETTWRSSQAMAWVQSTVKAILLERRSLAKMLDSSDSSVARTSRFTTSSLWILPHFIWSSTAYPIWKRIILPSEVQTRAGLMELMLVASTTATCMISRSQIEMNVVVSSRPLTTCSSRIFAAIKVVVCQSDL